MDPVSAAGLGLSVVQLSLQVFGVCVKGFVLMSTAGNLGKDATYLRTMLNLEEYRFVQWADTVGLTAAEPKLPPRLNQTLANELMSQLQVKLDIKQLKDRYKLDLQPQAPVTPASSNQQGPSDSAQGILRQAVSDERRGEILEKTKLIQRKNSMPKRLWWAAVDRASFESLLRDVKAIVDGLWALLEPLQQAEFSEKLERTISTIISVSDDIKGLRSLQSALQASVELQRNMSLAIAAGLKSTRIEIGDTIPQIGSTSDPKSLTTVARRSFQLLQAHLLTGFKALSHNALMGTGLYSGKPVFVEYKVVLARLKSKLKSRVENLASLLSQPKDFSFLTLQCLGYFEDQDNFVFVYEFPPDSYDPSDPEQSLPPVSLLDILRDPKSAQPSVTARLQLTLKICKTLQTIHTAGWLHKNLRSENILFFPTPSRRKVPGILEKPYITGFAFSRLDSPTEISEQPSENPLHDIYRYHKALGEPSVSFQMYMDLYSLGTILIEIAEWRPLKQLIRKCLDLAKPNISLTQIASVQSWLIGLELKNGSVKFRMGEVFGDGVERFLKPREPGDEDMDTADLLCLHRFVQELEKCYV